MRRRNGGFSLLETLAAMFLLALCFGALMHTAGASMALSSRAAGYTQASLWARSLLDRTFVVEYPSEGVHHGSFDDTYQWTMQISSPPDDAAIDTTDPLHVYKVELTVEWRQDGKPVTAHFETLRTVATRPVSLPIRPLSGDS